MNYQPRAWAEIRRLAKEAGIDDPKLAALLDVPESNLIGFDSGEVHPPSPHYCNGYRPLCEAVGLCLNRQIREIVAMVTEDRRHPVPNPRKVIQ